MNIKISMNDFLRLIVLSLMVFILPKSPLTVDNGQLTMENRQQGSRSNY